MKTLLIAASISVLAVPSAFGQSRPKTFPVSGTVIRVSTVLVPREESRTAGGSIVQLQAGTAVQVTGIQEPWYTVLFPSPQGNLPGLMRPQDIRIDPESAESRLKTGAAASERGLVEIRGFGFPQTAPGNSTRAHGEMLLRQEVFLKPAPWFHISAGADMRASSADEVQGDWQVDFEDRGVLRPRLAVRRLAVAIASRHVSVDVGKQFIRWGTSDIVSPVDRFAPRDYLNVADSEFLPVIGARASVRAGSETFEAVWQPQMTPSRLPLLDGRWGVVPTDEEGTTFTDGGSVFPTRSVQGARWSHSGRFDVALSAFDGFQHLPEITAGLDQDGTSVRLTRTYPRLRSVGGELTLPTSVFTLRAEAAYATSPTRLADDYVLYVLQAERQVGEWLLTGGYVGEKVTQKRSETFFAAERGIAGSIIGRAAYTISPRRSVEIEGAIGHGHYVRGTYSQAIGSHLRLTITGVGIGGDDDDFFGQYGHNSHVAAALRLSY